MPSRQYLSVFVLFLLSMSVLSGQEDLSYEELVDLALKYGLETRGNRLVLEERLRETLSADAPVRKVLPSPTEFRARVEQSDAGTYLQKPQGDELELQGSVVITVEDEEYSLTHSISADLILFNQDLEQLSAEGNVRYVMTGEAREDHFTGNRLLFLLDENETLFIDGGGRREGNSSSEASNILQQLKTLDKNEYYYTGEFISRSQDNVIVMDDGFITSSTNPSPNYRLQFKKVWILSPGEWGMEDAVLYVGNIPLFGLPFLYLPGNEIIFHPVFLSDDIRGFGLNTTTYLVGKKEAGDSPFSFLQMSGDRSGRGQSPMGIFLQPDNSPEPDDWASDTFNLVKLYADIYSIRGFILGIGFDFVPSDVSDAEGLVLFALTREMYQGTGDSVTSQYNSGEDKTDSVFHESRFAGLTIPFRFIVDLQLSLSLTGFDFSVTLPVYSDPFIKGEFEERAEDMPWATLLLGGSSGLRNLSFPQSTMSWNMQFSLSPDIPDVLNPFLKNLTISNMITTFNWTNAQAMNLPAEHTTAINSPELVYYVPQQVQFPSGTIALSGQLLQLPVQESSDTDSPPGEIPDAIGDFQTPIGEKKEAAALPSEPKASTKSSRQIGNFIQPPISSSAVTVSSKEDASYALSYSLSNKHFMVMFFENFSTDTPDLYEVSYSNFQDDINTSLNQKITLFQSLIDIQTQLNYSASLRESFGFSDRVPVATRDNVTRQSKMQERQGLNMTNTTAVNLFAPLYTDVQFSITHSLTLALWSWRNNGDGSVTSDEFTWDRDHVTSHRIGASFTLPLFDNLLRQKITASYSPPPVAQRLVLDYSLGVEFLTTSLKFTSRELQMDAGLVPTDLAWNVSINPWEQVSAQGNLSWTLNPIVAPEQYRLSLNVYWYNGQLTFLNRRTVRLNPTRTAWIQENDKKFGLSAMQHRLAIPVAAGEEGGVEFKSSITAQWNHDFIQFTSSNLSFRASMDILFPGFLFLRFSVTSVNNHIYKYFPEYSDQLGLDRSNFFEDLVRSFNFFNIADREASSFKLQSISVELLHDLGDWMLRAEYAWFPKVVSTAGRREYQFENKLSFFLQWLPISELKSEIDINISDDKWTVDY